MATIVGNVGTVFSSTNAVGEVTAFEYTDSAATVEDTAMGDTVVTRKHVIRDGKGSVTCHYDPADAQQLAMDAGSTVTLKLRPAGTGAALAEWTGAVIIEGKGFSQSMGEIVQIKFDFIGALTEGVQA